MTRPTIEDLAGILKQYQLDGSITNYLARLDQLIVDLAKEQEPEIVNCNCEKVRADLGLAKEGLRLALIGIDECWIDTCRDGERFKEICDKLKLGVE